MGTNCLEYSDYCHVVEQQNMTDFSSSRMTSELLSQKPPPPSLASSIPAPSNLARACSVMRLFNKQGTDQCRKLYNRARCCWDYSTNYKLLHCYFLFHYYEPPAIMLAFCFSSNVANIINQFQSFPLKFQKACDDLFYCRCWEYSSITDRSTDTSIPKLLLARKFSPFATFALLLWSYGTLYLLGNL